MAYDAFISYSHGSDGELAPVLRDGIQRFAKPWYRRRALHVFLDNSSLSANPGLWSSITDALDDAAWFVVLLSEQAAASPWVDQEIAYWREHRDVSRILPVLTCGSLVWDARSGGWDAASTAVPPSFEGAFAEEPRFIDLTWIADRSAIDRRDPRLVDAIADLAAPLHGLPKDELVGTDIREHRRALRLARAAAAILVVLTLAAATAAVVAVRNARTARRNQATAEAATRDAEFRALVAQSRDLRRSKRELSLLLAVEARKLRTTPESTGALQAAIIEDPRLLASHNDPRFASGYRSLCPIPGSHRSILGGNDGAFAVIDADDGPGDRQPGRQRLAEASTAATDADVPRSAVGCAVADDGVHGVVYTAAGRVWPLSLPDGALGAPVDLGHGANQLAVSPDGRWIAAGTVDGHLEVWPAVRPSARRTLDETDGLTSVAVAFSHDGSTLISTTRATLRYRRIGAWTIEREAPDEVADQSGGLVQLADPTRQLWLDRSGRYLLNVRRGVERLQDEATGAVRWEVPNNFVAGASATFSRDGGSVFVTGTSGIFTERSSVDGHVIGEPIHGLQNTTSAVVSDDGRTLYLPSRSTSVVGRWALDGRAEIATMIDAPGLRQDRSAAHGSMVLVPTGPSVVAAGEVRSIATGQLLGRFPTAAFPTLTAPRVVAAFYLDRLQVDRRDLTSGTYVGPSFRIDIAGVVQASVTSDGQVIVAYEDGSLRRFGSDGHEIGHPWKRLPFAADSHVVLSAGGRYVGAGGDDALILRGTDGRALWRADDRFLTGFSPDGRLVGLLAGDGTLEIRASATGRMVRRVRIDPTYVTYDLSHPDAHLASTGEEAQLYDPKTFRPLGDPFPSIDTPRLLGTGDRLATNTAQGVQIWDLDPDHWVRAACAMAGRNLTKAEQRAYLPAGEATEPTCPEWPPPA